MNDIKRLMSFWAIAPITPTIMVNSAITISVESKAPPVNTVERTRMKAYTPTLVKSPAKTAVTMEAAVG